MMEMFACKKRKPEFSVEKGRIVRGRKLLIKIRGRKRRRKFGYEI